MTSADNHEPVPMPAAIANLPRWRGIRVPCTAAVDNKGVPDFRVSDPEKWMRVVAERRCGICGEPLRYWLYFLGSPRQIQHQSFFWDPPMHEDCARYSAAVCPFLNGEKAPAVAAHVRARHPGGTLLEIPNKGRIPSAPGLLQARRYKLVEGAPPMLRAEGVAGCEWLRTPPGGVVTLEPRGVVPGVVLVSTCPHCGAPQTCCSQGRQRGAVGHGESERAPAPPLALQLTLDGDHAGALVGRQRAPTPPLSPSEV